MLVHTGLDFTTAQRIFHRYAPSTRTVKPHPHHYDADFRTKKQHHFLQASQIIVFNLFL
jgi:hypothetical protein